VGPPPRQSGIYQVQIGESGNYRKATPDEVGAINAHIGDYPRCDGSEMRDDADQTLLGMKPQLWCKDDRVKVTVRG
jgi:hypothetical protein